MSTWASGSRRGALRSSEVIHLVAVASIAVLGGAALAVDTRLAVAPVGLLLAALLLVDGRARTIFVVVGGMFVFQQGEGLSTTKLAYFALFSLAFLGALVRVRGLWDTPQYQRAQPLLRASAAFGCLVCASAIVAHSNATPLASAWLRDAAPFLLFAAAPVFALDMWASFTRRGLVRFLVTIGVIGAFAFAAEWFERRSIADLNASYFGLATIFLPGALFAFAMASVLQANRMRWLAIAAVVLALLLATGTRANLTLLLAPLAIAFGTRRYLVRRSVRLALIGPITVGITAALIVGALRVLNADEEQFYDRLTVARTSGTALDHSYIERVRQANSAWAVFESNPVAGAGPGTGFGWETVDGDFVSGFVLDTSLTFPAKFGVVGILVLLFVMHQYWLFARRLVREPEPKAAHLAVVGYLAIVGGSILFFSPFEDKGLALGLIAVLALAFCELHSPDTETYGARSG